MTASPRPRVLIEHENPRVRRAQAETLRAAGYEVATCGGPATLAGYRCPLVDGGWCEMAGDVDVIVNQLPLGHLRVYAAQRARLAHPPTLLGVSAHERARLPVVDRVATTVPRNLTGPTLVAAVRAALAGDDDPPVDEPAGADGEASPRT